MSEGWLLNDFIVTQKSPLPVGSSLIVVEKAGGIGSRSWCGRMGRLLGVRWPRTTSNGRLVRRGAAPSNRGAAHVDREALLVASVDSGSCVGEDAFCRELVEQRRGD